MSVKSSVRLPAFACFCVYAEVTDIREAFQAMPVAIAMGAAGLSRVLLLAKARRRSNKEKISSNAADLHIQPGGGPRSLDRLTLCCFFDIAKASKYLCLAGHV